MAPAPQFVAGEMGGKESSLADWWNQAQQQTAPNAAAASALPFPAGTLFAPCCQAAREAVAAIAEYLGE